jgi:hypothetical protein
MNYAYAESTISKMYFKDGKVDKNGNKVYIIDYLTNQFNSTLPLARVEPIDGANAVVTDTQIQLAGAMKTPVVDNPNAYDITPIDFTLDIKRVEAINGGQLNNYTLEDGQDFTYLSFTETSPTTATLTNVFMISEFNKEYFSVEAKVYELDPELEKQLKEARDRLTLEQEGKMQ